MQKILYRFSDLRIIQPKAFIIWNTNSILNVQLYKPLYQERKQLVLTQMGNVSVEWVPITRQDDKVNVEWNAKKIFTINPQQYGTIIDLLYNANKEIKFTYQGKEKIQKTFEIKQQKDGNYIVSLQEDRDQFQINATRGDIVSLAELIRFILPYSLGWHSVSQINFQQQQ
ncbi:hypothetical protein pb186bvf_009853 [Paramecium bursaria]